MQFRKPMGMVAFSPSACAIPDIHNEGRESPPTVKEWWDACSEDSLSVRLFTNMYHLKITKLKSIHTCRPLGSPRVSLHPQAKALPLVYCAVPLWARVSSTLLVLSGLPPPADRKVTGGQIIYIHTKFIVCPQWLILMRPYIMGIQKSFI